MCHLCRISITPTSEAAALSARLARVMGEAKKEEARDQIEAFQLLPLDKMGQTKIDFGSAHLSAQKSCSMLMDESWEPVQEIEIQPEIHTEMAAMDISLQTIARCDAGDHCPPPGKLISDQTLRKNTKSNQEASSENAALKDGALNH